MEDIIIKQSKEGCFDVHVGNKSAEQLTFEEMLGVVTQFTMPEVKHCLQWLKTEEEHQAFRNRHKSIQIQDIEYSNGIIKARFTSVPVHKENERTNETGNSDRD